MEWWIAGCELQITILLDFLSFWVLFSYPSRSSPHLNNSEMTSPTVPETELWPCRPCFCYVEHVSYRIAVVWCVCKFLLFVEYYVFSQRHTSFTQCLLLSMFSKFVVFNSSCCTSCYCRCWYKQVKIYTLRKSCINF